MRSLICIHSCRRKPCSLFESLTLCLIALHTVMRAASKCKTNMLCLALCFASSCFAYYDSHIMFSIMIRVVMFRILCLSYYVWHIMFLILCLAYYVSHIMFIILCLAYSVYHNLFIILCLAYHVWHIMFSTFCLAYYV